MAYDIGGFLGYIGGFDSSGDAGGSVNTSLGGYTFNNVDSATSFGHQMFTSESGWGSISPKITSGSYDTSGGASVPQLERVGGWAAASGIVALTTDAMSDSAFRTKVSLGDASMGTRTYENYGLSRQDLVDASSAAFTGLFPVTDGDINYNAIREFRQVFNDVSDGKQPYNALADASDKLVSDIANLNDTQIFAIANKYAAELKGRATLNGGDTIDFDTYSASVVRNVTDRLTIARNTAKSLVAQAGQDQMKTDARAAGQLYTQLGISLDKGEQLRSAVNSMGIVAAPAGSQEEGGKPTVSSVATTTVIVALLRAFKEKGIDNPNMEVVRAYAKDIAGDLASWSSGLESARSTLLSPDPDKGAAGVNDDDALDPRMNQGITARDLVDYRNAVDRFDDLPVYFVNGELRIKDGYTKILVDAEKTDRGTQLGAVSAAARSAAPGLDLVKNYHNRVAGGHFTGEYRFAADSLIHSGDALNLAGKERISWNGHDVELEEIRKAVAGGASIVHDLDGAEVGFDATEFLASDTGAVTKLNDYIDMARNYATTAPTIMSKLASAVDPGFLYNTNMLTGEKTLNGSNVIQLLLATGGIITPIATMLYQTERERRDTRKNQEYADRVRQEEREYTDRVRQEDREFQERLTQMQLASAETQASIAADSRNKAVATGGSRTRITINSPTQSK